MKLYIVGFGCGSRDGMTLQAEKAILESEIVVGYTTYVDIIKKFFPEKETLSTGMKKETERVRISLETAKNKTTALICSGDAELYGMAGLAYQLSPEYPDVEIQVIAGVTAGMSGGALLGSPLTNDFAVISLSDLLTPWEKIKQRLEFASKADFTIVIYNPSSKGRSEHLANACRILLEYKSPETVCGYVRNIGRDGEEYGLMTLSELEKFRADMFTTVFIGNSETKIINGKMITPRGYMNV